MNSWHSRLSALAKEAAEREGSKGMPTASTLSSVSPLPAPVPALPSASTPSVGEEDVTVEEHISHLSSLIAEVPEMAPFVRPRIRALTKIGPIIQQKNEEKSSEEREERGDEEEERGEEEGDVRVRFPFIFFSRFL